LIKFKFLKLVVDIGNTCAKLALFDKKKLTKHEIIPKLSLEKTIKFCGDNKIESSIFSSVVSLCESDYQIINFFDGLLFNNKTPVPIESNYKSEIGSDRLSAVIGANYLFPNKDIWVFDAGTCLTADFITKDKVHEGGRISPGIEMRYKSLHSFTSKLPSLSLEPNSIFKGNNTNESIISGVQQGILAEVRALISDFRKYNNDFVVVFTGGNSSFFEKELKSSIFADQFLVLKGLNEILDYNEKD